MRVYANLTIYLGAKILKKMLLLIIMSKKYRLK